MLLSFLLPVTPPLLQDALLLEGVGKLATHISRSSHKWRDWVEVAAHVSKSGGCVVDNEQCRKRYRENLDPALQKLKNGPWTEAEVITTHSPHPHYLSSNLLPLLCTLHLPH
jgi:hypothetical protein